MSEGTVALVERLYEGLDRADIEAVLALFDPEVEIATPPSLPWSAGNYTGLDGAAAYFGKALEYLEETQFLVEEIRPSDDWAAAIGNWTGRFRESGGEFNVRFVHFWEFRDDRVIKGSGISDTVGIVRAFSADPASAA